MSDEKHVEIVIVKRRGSRHEDGHHGGAWKIAYADFMTAMMAFFLVLWLVNSSGEKAKDSISRYFNPIKLVDSTVSRKGLASNKEVENAHPKKAPDDKAASVDEAGGEVAAKTPEEKKAESKAPDGKTPEGKAPDGKASDGKAGDSKATDSKAAAKAAAGDPLGEDGLFANPEAALNEIASRAEPKLEQIEEGKIAGAQFGTAARGEAYRDPFQPLVRPSPAKDNLDLDDRLRLPANVFRNDARDPAKDPAIAAAKGDSKDSGKSGAGADAKTVAMLGADAKPATPDLKNLSPEAAKQAEEAKQIAERQRDAATLQTDLEQKLGSDLGSGAGPRLEVKATPEGLLVSLTDDVDYGMFAVGSAQPQPKVVRMMQEIGETLKARNGFIVIRGHTDSRPYKAGGYDNWRLSSDRAQIARFMLLRGGIPESRVEHVEGWADRKLRFPTRPDAAENRRIEILIRGPST